MFDICLICFCSDSSLHPPRQESFLSTVFTMDMLHQLQLDIPNHRRHIVVRWVLLGGGSKRWCYYELGIEKRLSINFRSKEVLGAFGCREVKWFQSVCQDSSLDLNWLDLRCVCVEWQCPSRDTVQVDVGNATASHPPGGLNSWVSSLVDYYLFLVNMVLCPSGKSHGVVCKPCCVKWKDSWHTSPTKTQKVLQLLLSIYQNGW